MLIDLRDDRRSFIKIPLFTLYTLFNTLFRPSKILFRQSVDSLINLYGWNWVRETAVKTDQQDLAEVMRLWEAFAGARLAYRERKLLNEDETEFLRRSQAPLLYPNREHFSLLNSLLPLYGEDVGRLRDALESCYILGHIPDPALKQRLYEYFDERRQNVQAPVVSANDPIALYFLTRYKNSPDFYFIKGLLKGPYVTSHLNKNSLSLPDIKDDWNIPDELLTCYEDVTHLDSREASRQESSKLQKLVGYLALKIASCRHLGSIDTISDSSLKILKTMDAVVQVLLKNQLAAV